MADRFLDLSIEWDGLDVLHELFKEMQTEFKKIVIEEMTKFALQVESSMRALAPVDTGDLQESIKAGQARVLKDGGVAVTIGTHLDYALAVHEKPYTSGTRAKYDKGVKYPGYYVDGRGFNTRIKHNYRGYQPGRKYMQNAINASEEDWQICLKRILERSLQGGLL